jgi:F-type H+-transporting ATPase subunit alpha
VEKQIAIIYCGTKGLLRDVPVNKIREFEAEYLMVLENRHPQVLSDLRAGKYTDEITGLLESVAKDVAKKFAS